VIDEEFGLRSPRSCRPRGRLRGGRGGARGAAAVAGYLIDFSSALTSATGPRCLSLSWVDDPADAVDLTVAMFERHHADEALLFVEIERARAAVDLDEAHGQARQAPCPAEPVDERACDPGRGRVASAPGPGACRRRRRSAPRVGEQRLEPARSPCSALEEPVGQLVALLAPVRSRAAFARRGAWRGSRAGGRCPRSCHDARDLRIAVVEHVVEQPARPAARARALQQHEHRQRQRVGGLGVPGGSSSPSVMIARVATRHVALAAYPRGAQLADRQPGVTVATNARGDAILLASWSVWCTRISASCVTSSAPTRCRASGRRIANANGRSWSRSCSRSVMPPPALSPARMCRAPAELALCLRSRRRAPSVIIITPASPAKRRAHERGMRMGFLAPSAWQHGSHSATGAGSSSPRCTTPRAAVSIAASVASAASATWMKRPDAGAVATTGNFACGQARTAPSRGASEVPGRRKAP